jgi:hypothetical protein
MRRLWLTLMLSFALVAGGLASAGAAFACPSQAPAAAHDCCPDQGSSNHGNQSDEQGMTACAFMQLCRTAPAVAPEAAPVQLAAPAFVLAAPSGADSVLVAAAADGLFRPPRTI